MTKLHLGCGNIRLDGFINIDVRHTPATDKVMDISDLAEFSDNSVDMIYASHCLEHFSFRIVPDILTEWNRALKRGGVLILRVPDFDILVNTYLRRHPNSDRPQALNFSSEEKYLVKLLKIIGYLIRKRDDKESLLSRIKRVIGLYFRVEKRSLNINLLGDFLGGQNYAENQHKAFFNEKLLRDLLCKAGFGEIKRIDFDYFPVNDASKHYSTMGFSSRKIREPRTIINAQRLQSTAKLKFRSKMEEVL